VTKLSVYVLLRRFSRVNDQGLNHDSVDFGVNVGLAQIGINGGGVGDGEVVQTSGFGADHDAKARQ
jgi:hypothetical protein